jgi:hypothetical protein
MSDITNCLFLPKTTAIWLPLTVAEEGFPLTFMDIAFVCFKLLLFLYFFFAIKSFQSSTLELVEMIFFFNLSFPDYVLEGSEGTPFSGM